MQALTTAAYDYYLTSSLGFLELAGSVFSLLSVWCAFQHSQWTWIWGLPGVTCYGLLFFVVGLYADSALQFLFYVPVQIVGFLTWRRLIEQHGTKFWVRNSSWPWYTTSVVAILLLAYGTSLLTPLMGEYLGVVVQYAFWDAVIVWGSVFAQVLMAGKYWESWVLWVTVDVIAVPVYAGKELYVVAGVYAVFLVVAALGLVDWYSRQRRQKLARV